MAEQSTLARPYAQALFGAVSTDQYDGLKLALLALSKLIANSDIALLIGNPQIEKALLGGFLLDTLKEQKIVPSPELTRFVAILAEAQRLSVLTQIYEIFVFLVDQSRGVSDCLIESPFPLEEQTVLAIVPKLEKCFSRHLNLRFAIRPELIGGLVATVGDKVLDLSIQGDLQRMRLALAR